MFNFSKFTAASALAVALTAGATSAATLSIVGGAPVALPGNYDLGDAAGPLPDIGDLFTNFVGAGGGLLVNSAAYVTFTFLGKEAGNSNAAIELIGGGTLNDDTVGDTLIFTQLVAGFVNFMFQTNGAFGDSITNGGASTLAGLDMAFSSVFNGGQSVYALFGDGGGGNDNDYDDMLVRIDVAAIPVPAAGFLLLGALGGLAALRRRKA